MEKFDVKKFLENPSRKVVTKDGLPVKITCTDTGHLDALVEKAMKITGNREILFDSTGRNYHVFRIGVNDAFFESGDVHDDGDDTPESMLMRLKNEICLMDSIYRKCFSAGDIDSGVVVRTKVMDSLPSWTGTIGDIIDELKRRKS